LRVLCDRGFRPLSQQLLISLLDPFHESTLLRQLFTKDRFNAQQRHHAGFALFATVHRLLNSRQQRIADLNRLPLLIYAANVTHPACHT